MCVLIFNTLIIFKDLEIREPSLIISVPLPAIVGGHWTAWPKKKEVFKKNISPKKESFPKLLAEKKGSLKFPQTPLSFEGGGATVILAPEIL